MRNPYGNIASSKTKKEISDSITKAFNIDIPEPLSGGGLFGKLAPPKKITDPEDVKILDKLLSQKEPLTSEQVEIISQMAIKYKDA
jgi:hypothetical protein